MDDMPMYKALLKWSLSQSDGTEPSTAVPMTDEKREFLRAAMESYVLDETKRMKDIVTILEFKASKPEKDSNKCTLSYQELVDGAIAARLAEKKKETSFLIDSLSRIDPSRLPSIKLDALQELTDRVEQIDNATYFACAAGGSGQLPLILGFLSKQDSALQFEALNVLKTMLQNNPKCQAKALQIGALNAILIPTQTSPEIKIRIKAFSTLSALLRCSTSVPILAFANAGGLEKCVMPALTNSDAPQLQKKALFFLQYAVSADPSFPAKRFADAGIVDYLTGLLASKDDDIAEQSATILEAVKRSKK